MLKVLASSVRRFLSIIWSIDGTRLARLAKRQSLHGEGFVVGKNVWSAPTKLGKDGHYRDSLPRQRARSYHQYWPTSRSRSFAECVRNVMIRVLMDTQTCSKSAIKMHIKLTQSIAEWHKQRNNFERWLILQDLQKVCYQTRAPFKSLCPHISPSWWRCPWPPWRRCCWLRVDVEY